MFKPLSKLTRSVGTVGAFTLVSRILGFVRDAVIAWLLGAGLASDAFFVAFRLPDLFRKLFSDGVLTLSFVPVFTTCLVQGGRKQAFAMARSCFLLVSTAGGAMAIAGIAAAPMLVRIIAPGFAPESDVFTLVVLLTRIMMPYLVFVALLAVSMGVLNSMEHFTAPAAAPIVLNLGMIFGALALSSLFSSPALALALGVVLGGFFQLALQVPFLLKQGFRFFEKTTFVHKRVFETGKLMLPSLVGAAGFQINLFVATVMASTLSYGSISYLYYAERLVQFPMALFAVSISTVLLPELSREKVSGKDPAVPRVFARAVKALLCITLPAMAGLAALREPVVSVLFKQGAFDLLCVKETASVLLFFCMGLWAFSGNRLFIALFHARGDFTTPFLASVKAIGFNLVFGFFMGRIFGYRGLAFSVSSAAAINCFLLMPGVWADMDAPMKKNLAFWACRSFFSSVIMYGSVVWSLGLIPNTISKAGLLVRVAGIIILGVAVYAGTFILIPRQGLWMGRQDVENQR